MKKFLKLTEHNDNEGEDWNFYIQVDGNEKAIDILNEVFEEDTCDFFEVGEVVPENEVDILVKHSDGGYMDYENKVNGILDIPSGKGIDPYDYYYDNLYKGNISAFIKKK